MPHHLDSKSMPEDGIRSMQFSQIQDMLESLQKSIVRIEKSQEHQTAMMHSFQGTMLSQHETLLEMQTSTGFKMEGPTSPHLSDKLLSSRPVPQADTDFHLQTPVSSRRPSADALDSGTAMPVKRTRLSCRGSESVDLDSFVDRHGRRPNNVRELEDVKATSLRRQNSRNLVKSKGSASTSDHLGAFRRRPPPLTSPESPESVEQVVLPSQVPPSPTVNKTKIRTFQSQSMHELPTVEGKRWMSMEKLRQSYDAVVMGANGSGTLPNLDEATVGKSAFPCLGRVSLCLVGHLRFGTGLGSRVFSFFSAAVIPLSLTALLACATSMNSGITSPWSVTMGLTVSFFQLGVSFASLSFRYNDIDLLLGPAENQLDDYAEERGFMQDWQRKSRRRLVETVCALVCMMLVRGLTNLALGDTFAGRLAANRGLDVAVFSWCLWVVVIRFLLLCYAVLHVACGLELALDSFTVRFFNELDLEEALEEWNVLQATLRQVSSKMSDAILAIGFCSIAGVAILGESVIFGGSVEPVTNWLTRFYPLILFFLYCIMRAAEVTEKASRVGPLVNSWQFEGEAGWMDAGRQYAVQYINQSRAGFYLRGAQLTMPTVQRTSYYFAAISVALLSRLFQVS